MRPPIFLPAAQPTVGPPCPAPLTRWLSRMAALGEGLRSCGDAHLDPQAIVELFPQAVPAPGAEVIEDGGLGWNVLGQHAPLAPGAVEREDGVEDGSARVLDGPPAGLGLGNERLKALPSEIGEVTGIGLRWVHPKLDGWTL